MPRIIFTPWRDDKEFLLVRSQFYRSPTSKDPDMRRKACSHVSAWKLRGNLPHAVESTAFLIDAVLHDDVKVNSTFAIRAVYSTAFCRFVTGFVDTKLGHKQRKTMYQKAKAIGLPASYVELRHEATHIDLPPLVVLRRVTERSLQWLWDYYWKHTDVQTEKLDAFEIPAFKDGSEKLKEKLRIILLTHVKACVNDRRAARSEEKRKRTKSLETETTDHEVHRSDGLERGQVVPYEPGKQANEGGQLVDDKENENNYDGETGRSTEKRRRAKSPEAGWTDHDLEKSDGLETSQVVSHGLGKNAGAGSQLVDEKETGRDNDWETRKAQKEELRKAADEQKQTCSHAQQHEQTTVIELVRICEGNKHTLKELVAVLLEPKILVPHDKILGRDIGDCISLWDGLLKKLTVHQLPFLPMLTNEMSIQIILKSPLDITIDPYRESITMWLEHIFTAKDWRKALKRSNIDMNVIMSTCMMNPDHWTLRLATAIMGSPVTELLKNFYAEQVKEASEAQAQGELFGQNLATGPWEKHEGYVVPHPIGWRL